MLKVLIADDEPKIRRGLRKIIDWDKMDMQVLGEAEDGEMALEMAKKLRPDILLVDICMPFLNGLELIEQINAVLSDCRIIIISGYDKFEYAQQALKLRVFEFVLKPIVKERLVSVILKAKEELMQSRSRDKYASWASRQMDNNFSYFRERLLKDFVNDSLTEAEAREQMNFLGIQLDNSCGIIIVKIVERLSLGVQGEEWDKELLIFAVRNIVEELLQDWKPGWIFRDNRDNIVAIVPLISLIEWEELGAKIEAPVEEHLKQFVVVGQLIVEGGISEIPHTYEMLLAYIKEKVDCSPFVMLARKYIEENYHKEDLSLQEVAEKIGISSAYLSRLLKNEVGYTFIDFLTKVRVKKAIQFMSDPTTKIYEVAERVGYNTQHYFSTAFKKVLGVSPLEYKKGDKLYDR